MSSKPTSSSRAPNRSSHDRSTTARCDAMRWLQAPAQARRGRMSAGRAAGTSPIRVPRVLDHCPPDQLRVQFLPDGGREAGNRPPNNVSISRRVG